MSETSSLKHVIGLCHVELDRLFLAHQEQLLTGDLLSADAALQRYRLAHDLHKRFEDEHLIGPLEDLEDPGPWPAALYGKEHDKIDTQLARIVGQLGALIEQDTGGTALRLELIALLDREKTFKGLCEHHQEREEAGLLPVLDAQTTAEWRMTILEPFNAEWQALLATFPRPA